MPHYFLDLLKGGMRVRDPDGEEFVNLIEARAEAVLSLRKLMSEIVCSGMKPDGVAIEVIDLHGHVDCVLGSNDVYDD